MSRGTVVYLGMLAAFVAGLWATLAVGGRLTAPADLSGRWSATTPAGWRSVRVEQSGQYFELAFEGGPTVAASVRQHDPDGRLVLARDRWRVTVGPPAGPDGTRAFAVDGPTAGTFVGTRDKPAAAK